MADPAGVLLRCVGGMLRRPGSGQVLVDCEDGGHLLVDPPRPVWDRSALTPTELHAWSSLVAAAAQAMLEVLPALSGGCINYWDAGNWSLNPALPPAGPKAPRQHRQLHLHLLGRSPSARSPDWQWGEAPRFPRWVDRQSWALPHRPLPEAACRAVAERCRALLLQRFALASELG